MAAQLVRILNRVGKKSVMDLMEPVDVSRRDENISKIIGMLIKKNNYNVYIADEKKITVVGLIDILSSRDIMSQKIGTIAMSVPNISYNSTVEIAARLMNYYKLRSVPIIKNNKLIGQITSRSIIIAMKELDLRTPLSRIMTPNPISLSDTDMASTAKNIMIRNKIDHIPIVGNKLNGMITSFNLIKAMLPSAKLENKSLGFPVKSISDHNFITSELDDTVSKLIKSFYSSKSTYSVVTLGEEVQGIITQKDIISLFGEKVEEEIPAYIIGLPDEPFSSELVKSKFRTLIKLIKKIIPELEEARCRIKLKNVRGKTKRYEVDVGIFTPSSRFHYTTNGLELPVIFDQIRDSLKKKLSQKVQKRQKQSKRYKMDNEYD